MNFAEITLLLMLASGPAFKNPTLAKATCDAPGWNDVCWATCDSQSSCEGCCDQQFSNDLDSCFFSDSCYDQAFGKSQGCSDGCDGAFKVNE